MAKVKKTIVSVDFDFWVPEDPMLDMGHQESALFIDMMWGIRASTQLDIEKKLTLSAELPKPCFLGHFLKQRGLSKPKSLWIAESHASILPLLANDNKVDVISVDAHHDFGYSFKDPDCGSWVRVLAEQGKLNSIHLIYPLWRNEDKYRGDWHEEIRNRVIEWGMQGINVLVTYGLETFPENVKVDKMFICRSGAWVPPWLDDEFISMVMGVALGFRIPNYGVYTYQDLSAFRRKMDWSAIEKARKQTQEQMKKFCHAKD